MTGLENVSFLYYELIDIYKKSIIRFLKKKRKTGGKKHDYKNLKDLNYQVDKAHEKKKRKNEDKADETVQELPPWIKSKDEFNELKNCMLSVNNSLKTSTNKYQYNFTYMKELIKRHSEQQNYKE